MPLISRPKPHGTRSGRAKNPTGSRSTRNTNGSKESREKIVGMHPHRSKGWDTRRERYGKSGRKS